MKSEQNSLTYTKGAQFVVSQGKNPSILSTEIVPKDVVAPDENLRLLTRAVPGYI